MRPPQGMRIIERNAAGSPSRAASIPKAAAVGRVSRMAVASQRHAIRQIDLRPGQRATGLLEQQPDRSDVLGGFAFLDGDQAAGGERVHAPARSSCPRPAAATPCVWPGSRENCAISVALAGSPASVAAQARFDGAIVEHCLAATLPCALLIGRSAANTPAARARRSGGSTSSEDRVQPLLLLG